MLKSWLIRVPGVRRLWSVSRPVQQVDPLTQALTQVPLKTWLWSELDVRRRIQARGINPVPTSFYSNTPTIADIEGSFEYADPNVPPYDLGVDDSAMRAELESLIPYAQAFAPPVEDAGDSSYFWDNGLFGGNDAMAYYCYIRKRAPKTVLEIGSGFSSLVALAALKANGSGRLRCVEPYPRDFLKDRADIDLIAKPAQQISPEFINDTLADGDILFIDSTHTVKSGSDCLHIYLRLLPKIRRNLHVHAHDIHLPFGMPKVMLLHKQIHWTEQYLLLAFLLDNPKARILYGSRYHVWRNPQLLEQMMQGKTWIGGASFWFEYRGAQA